MQVPNLGSSPALLLLPLLLLLLPLLLPAFFTTARWVVMSRFGQLAARRCRAFFSVRSTVSRQRVFTIVHCATYVHCAFAGSHSAGSWSLLDRFEEAETAIRARESVRSFA